MSTLSIQNVRWKSTLVGLALTAASTTAVQGRLPREIAGFSAQSCTWAAAGSMDADENERSSYLATPHAFYGGENSDSYPASITISSQDLIKELHSSSGLTWDQLARLFGVSRRSLHHWASGGRMNAANEELLAKIVKIVAQVPGENSAERRSQILQPREDTTSLFDHIRSWHASESNDINRPAYDALTLLGVAGASET